MKRIGVNYHHLRNVMLCKYTSVNVCVPLKKSDEDYLLTHQAHPSECSPLLNLLNYTVYSRLSSYQDMLSLSLSPSLSLSLSFFLFLSHTHTQRLLVVLTLVSGLDFVNFDLNVVNQLGLLY